MSDVILPKGTIVKIQGLPVELAQDTPVYSKAIKKLGLDNFLYLFAKGESSTAST
jgi:hypothetical protein